MFSSLQKYSVILAAHTWRSLFTGAGDWIGLDSVILAAHLWQEQGTGEENKHTNKQTNKKTNKQTNKQTSHRSRAQEKETGARTADETRRCQAVGSIAPVLREILVMRRGQFWFDEPMQWHPS